MTKISVIVPAMNEESRIGRVLAAIPRQLPGSAALSVVVVDDGSSDRTGEAARQAGARVLRHRINLGKGAALRTGCESALAAGADLLVLMDADGQHRADDLARLVRPLIDDEADLVTTYRALGGQMPAVMRAGNWGLSAIFAVLFGRQFRDTQCGYRAMTAAAYGRVRWEATGYEVETEMLIRSAWAKLRVAEISIETIYHDRFKGTTAADGIRIFGAMLRWVSAGPELAQPPAASAALSTCA